METARPTTAGEVADILAAANADGRSIELRGGGSKADVGHPDPVDILLDLSALAAVESYDPPELVLRAGAGARLTDIDALLAAQNQMLAFEPADYGPLFGKAAGQHTLAGVICANASGPRRMSAGAVRDHFLGFDAVAGRGEVFKAGGPVVKNVTGYDLPKTIAGSWGTLAALTSVTLKVMPRPRTAVTLAIHGLTDQAAAKAMSQAVGSPVSVSAAAHLPAGVTTPGLSGPVTLLRLEGVEPSVAARTESLKLLLKDAGDIALFDGETTATLWRHLRDVGPFVSDPRPLWRISVPPVDGWRAVEALASLSGQAFYDWAGGLIWFACEMEGNPAATAGAIRAAARSVGGHAALFRAPAAIRAVVPPFDLGSAGLTLLSSRIKTAFDPNGVLSPGRFPGSLSHGRTRT